MLTMLPVPLHIMLADITCTIPVNGNFTEQQALVYNAVLDAHESVVAAMGPGVSWPDMQASVGGVHHVWVWGGVSWAVTTTLVHSPW
jgi:hypothetical protein